jgi:parallel beta-helix repeat protein
MALGMEEARTILGLGVTTIHPDEIVSLQRKRDALVACVDAAANHAERRQRQQELARFDAALDVVARQIPTARKQSLGRTVAVALALFWLSTLAIFCIGWHHQQQRQQSDWSRDVDMRRLETLGWQLIDKRQWPEADAVFTKIGQTIPGSALASMGHAAAATGRHEEETQFIGYWTGRALAELDASRLDEAEAALQRVIERRPAHPEVVAITQRISHERAEQIVTAEIVAIQMMIDQRNFPTATQRADTLLLTYPDRSDVAHLQREAHATWQRIQHDLTRAMILFEQARARDSGQFDSQALAWLREATLLAPDHAEIAALLEKMSSYTRTIRVPCDVLTPQEALAQARNNDRIVIGPGIWRGPLLIRHSVEIQGAGPAETILVCSAEVGSVMTIRDAKARVLGLTVRHESLHAEPGDRFSAATVTSGSCEFIHCHFTMANGHGLAVVGGARVTAHHCRFFENAWNGIAAIGPGSHVRVESSEVADNFHNGFESWEGASFSVHQNRITGNSRNGIHSDQGESAIQCENNTITGNREFGICLTSAGRGRICGNKVSRNLLGGILIRKKSAEVIVTDNESISHTGPDLILETGLPQLPYAANTLTPHRHDALQTDAIITP